MAAPATTSAPAAAPAADTKAAAGAGTSATPSTDKGVAVGGDGLIIESTAAEVYETFDSMGLREELLVRSVASMRT